MGTVASGGQKSTSNHPALLLHPATWASHTRAPRDSNRGNFSYRRCAAAFPIYGSFSSGPALARKQLYEYLGFYF